MLIVAALGLNYTNENNIKKIILAGTDVLRFSFVGGTIEQNLENIKNSIRIIDELNSSAKIMVNMPTNKMRIIGQSEPIMVQENEEIFLSSDSATTNSENSIHKTIRVNTNELGKKIYINQVTSIDRGKIALQIIEIINNDLAKARVLNRGIIRTSHSINIVQNSSLDEYLNNLAEVLENLRAIQPHYLSLPFISTSANEYLKKHLSWISKTKIIIRVEDQNGIDNIDNICQDQFVFGVVVNRGELGVNAPFEKLGIIQKQLIKKIKKCGKIALVASQILEGTINNFVPLRSDILDLTNIILDGADGIILTSETALSNRPTYTLAVARRIITEVEQYRSLEINDKLNSDKNKMR